MAIQMRRGSYSDFDPTKMLAGEWAIVTGGDPNTASGRAIYHAFAAGQVERVATYVDAAQIIINAIPDTVDALTEAVEIAEELREQAEVDREKKVISSATATVDSNTGTPSVDVALGQPATGGRGIAFAFHNLKGPKGDTVSVEPVSTSQIDTIVADGTVSSNIEALTGAGLTYLWDKLKAKFAALVNGVVTVAQGGTGAASHTANAVLTGNGTSAVNNVATADGALYATSANGAPQFGTLPIAQGGTGGTSAANARTNLGTPASSSIASVEQSTATASHAKDSHFMLDGELRKATSAIAAGESITSNNSTTDTVQGQIDTLRDSVSHSGWKTLTTGCYYCKIGQVLYIRIHGIKVSQGDTAIGTLPSGYRPSYDFDALPVAMVWADGYHQVFLNIKSNGTVYAHNGDSVQRSLWALAAIPL